MENSRFEIKRSKLFIVGLQLEGLCTGPRIAVPAGGAPGPGTLALLRKLRDDFLTVSDGSAVKDFPEFSTNLSAVDVLVVAETLRMSVLAFLNPDDRQEQRRVMGFGDEAARKPGVAADAAGRIPQQNVTWLAGRHRCTDPVHALSSRSGVNLNDRVVWRQGDGGAVPRRALPQAHP